MPPSPRPRPVGVSPAAFALLLVSLLAGCGGGEPGGAEGKGEGGRGGGGGPPRDPVPVTLAPARLEPLERTVDLVGSLYGDEEATISAKVPGRIRQIVADVGDRVPPGAPLAQVDPTDYELAIAQREAAVTEALAELGLTELPPADFDVTKVATVERARFQAANAKAKLERARQLFEQKPPLISEQDFADLETAFEVAQRDHEVAKLTARSQIAVARTRNSEREAAAQRLADTTARAPGAADAGSAASPESLPSAATTRLGGDGRFAVSQRNVSVGEYVREGDAMFRLVADDPIKFRGGVPERFVSDLRVGQTVTVRIEGSPDAFAGRISRVNPAIDPQSRTFQIEAIVQNDRRLLRPGAFARGSVRVGEDEGVTFVPRAAIVSFAGVDKVFTVKDGKAVEHVVRQGPRREDYVAIREGLSGQVDVVVGGAGKLAKDVPVQIGAVGAAAATQQTTAAAGAAAR